jgi:hypothetical protein
MAGTEDVSFLAGELRIIKSVSSVSVRFPSSCISGMDVIVLGGHRKSATIDQVHTYSYIYHSYLGSSGP